MKKFFEPFVFVLLIFCSQIFAQDYSNYPSFDYPTFDFADEKNLTPQQMIYAGLVFSEYPTIKDFSKYQNQFNELVKNLHTEYFNSLTQKEKAEEILTIMYDKILKRYSLKQTKITTMFDEGTYNCVSASVLYMALAKSAGLDVCGNRAPDHCFCSVTIDGKKYDVETTNPMGFNPGEKRMISQNGSGTTYAMIPKKNYIGRYSVSDKMLVSLVARNVTAFEMDKRNYKTAFPLASARLIFLQNDTESEKNDSRRDFDLVASNYAADLQRQKKFYQSMEWLDLVIEKWGIGEGLSRNYSDAIYNAVLFYCNQGEFSSAKEILNERKIYLSQNDFDELSQIIFETPWIQKISKSSNEKKFLEAIDLCNQALKISPNNTKIKKLLQTVLTNYDITIHNQFATFANKGDYDNAKKVLEEGLKNHPESTTLKNDLRKIKN